MARKVRNTPSGQKRGRKKKRDEMPNVGFQEPSGGNCIRSETVYLNLDEELIVIPLDKLRLLLRDYMEVSARGRHWPAAVVLTITLLLVFATSNFQSTLGLSGSVWHAFFAICLAASFVWSAVCVISALRAVRSKKTIEDFIGDLKENSKRLATKRQWEVFQHKN
jgi:heme exporter protein D